MKHRRSRIEWSKQERLIEHFVSCSTARCAARLVGVNKTTAAYYFHRLRELIALQMEREADDVFEGGIEVDESYFGGEKTPKPEPPHCIPVKNRRQLPNRVAAKFVLKSCG